MLSDIETVQKHYDASVLHEWNRIDGRPEFLLTCRMMDRYIKQGQSVLDIGGGPGRYSMYLAEKGCDVTLFDLSLENVKFAKKKAKELGVRIETLSGDAREADSIVPGAFDHVLLMGPMYHILEEKDRVRAMDAALNLLKPGGLIFVSFINTFAGIVYYMQNDPAELADESNVEFIKKLINRESFGGDAFTKAFFTEYSEILPFMAKFPIEKLHLFGQEGVLAPCEAKFMAQPKEVLDMWLDLSEKLWEREEYFGFSEHLMYVGRKG